MTAPSYDEITRLNGIIDSKNEEIKSLLFSSQKRINVIKENFRQEKRAMLEELERVSDIHDWELRQSQFFFIKQKYCGDTPTLEPVDADGDSTPLQSTASTPQQARPAPPSILPLESRRIVLQFANDMTQEHIEQIMQELTDRYDDILNWMRIDDGDEEGKK